MSSTSNNKLIRFPQKSDANEDNAPEAARAVKVERIDGSEQQPDSRPADILSMQESFLPKPSTQPASRADSFDATFGHGSCLTAEVRASYVRACTMCEFMTSVASAMELSGGLNESLSDRMDDFIEPVRRARDWMRQVGQLMVRSLPLPNRLREALEVAEYRALDSLSEFKALVDEACDDLAGGAQRPKADRDAARRSKVVVSKVN
jgi:hypothetical protein